jgi:hypothetical protein
MESTHLLLRLFITKAINWSKKGENQADSEPERRSKRVQKSRSTIVHSRANFHERSSKGLSPSSFEISSFRVTCLLRRFASVKSFLTGMSL